MPRERLLFAFILLTLGIFIIAYAPESSAEGLDGSFYRYQTEDGVTSYTDDAKRIPTRYKAQAVARTWAELAKKMARRSTVMKFSDIKVYVPVPIPRPELNPNRLPDCSGHVSVTKLRVQEGTYNRELFVVRDECGRTVSVTQGRPHIHINR